MLRVCQQLASTVQNVEQSLLLLVTQATNLSLHNAPFCCLCRNVEVSCRKHFIVFSGNQHCHLLPVMCHNLRHGGLLHRRPRLQHLACCSVNTGSQARYRLRIAISAYPTCIRHPRQGRFSSEYCYAVWHLKTRMAWLPDGEKVLMICYSF